MHLFSSKVAIIYIKLCRFLKEVNHISFFPSDSLSVEVEAEVEVGRRRISLGNNKGVSRLYFKNSSFSPYLFSLDISSSGMPLTFSRRYVTNKGEERERAASGALSAGAHNA